MDVCFFVLMGLYAVEVLLLDHFDISRSWDMTLMTVPASFSFFLFTLTVKCKAGEKDFAALRPYSNLLYYAHPGAISFLSNTVVSFDGLNSAIRYVFVVIVCFIGCFILLKLEKIKVFRWLTYLHK